MAHGTWQPQDNGPVLVLSPHLDDVIFSAFASVSSGPTEVWTVFAGAPDVPVTTGWDRSCGFDNSDQTIAARRAEDEAAFHGTEARIRHLPFLDGPYTTPERRTQDIAELGRELDQWMSAHPGATVLLPAGAGARVAPAWWERWRRPSAAPAPPPAHAEPLPAGPQPMPSGKRNPVRELLSRLMHADYRRRRAAALRKGLAVNNDHVAVRDRALDVAHRHPGVRVVLYEDLPYLWAQPADEEVAATTARRGLTATLVTLPVDTSAKFARCQAYSTQVGVMDPVHRRLSTPGHLPTEERYWILTKEQP